MTLIPTQNVRFYDSRLKKDTDSPSWCFEKNERNDIPEIFGSFENYDWLRRSEPVVRWNWCDDGECNRKKSFGYIEILGLQTLANSSDDCKSISISGLGNIKLPSCIDDHISLKNNMGDEELKRITSIYYVSDHSTSKNLSAEFTNGKWRIPIDKDPVLSDRYKKWVRDVKLLVDDRYHKEKQRRKEVRDSLIRDIGSHYVINHYDKEPQKPLLDPGEQMVSMPSVPAAISIYISLDKLRYGEDLKDHFGLDEVYAHKGVSFIKTVNSLKPDPDIYDEKTQSIYAYMAHLINEYLQEKEDIPDQIAASKRLKEAEKYIKEINRKLICDIPTLGYQSNEIKENIKLMEKNYPALIKVFDDYYTVISSIISPEMEVSHGTVLDAKEMLSSLEKAKTQSIEHCEFSIERARSKAKTKKIAESIEGVVKPIASVAKDVGKGLLETASLAARAAHESGYGYNPSEAGERMVSDLNRNTREIHRLANDIKADRAQQDNAIRQSSVSTPTTNAYSYSPKSSGGDPKKMPQIYSNNKTNNSISEDMVSSKSQTSKNSEEAKKTCIAKNTLGHDMPQVPKKYCDYVFDPYGTDPITVHAKKDEIDGFLWGGNSEEHAKKQIRKYLKDAAKAQCKKEGFDTVFTSSFEKNGDISTREFEKCEIYESMGSVNAWRCDGMAQFRCGRRAD